MARAWAGALVAVLALSACQSLGTVPSASIGYAAGPDGMVGLVGSKIALDVDPNDRKVALDAEYRALDSGETGVGLDWRGRNAVAGVVVPGPRYRVNDFDCRQITQTVNDHDATESATATACRGVDGAWRIVG